MDDKMLPFDYGTLYTPQMKRDWVGGYLNNPDNSNKNFVQRIAASNPNVAISRPVEGQPNWHESLRMSNSDNRVFPLLEMRDGRLQSLNETPDGYRHMGARQRPQETIATSTPEQAQVLAWNEYKNNHPQDFGYHDPSQGPQGMSLADLMMTNKRGLLSEGL